MAIPIDEVTPTTPCPDRRGGPLHHYPFTRAGKAVTMPGPDIYRFGGTAPHVMLALCTTAIRPMYLVAPSTKPDPAKNPTMCVGCLYERFRELRQAKEQGQFVGNG